MKWTLFLFILIPVFLSAHHAGEKTKIRSKVNQKSTRATFPEEYGSWGDFIDEHKIYPAEALKNGSSAYHTVSFDVEVDGSLTFIKMWKKDGEIYEEEIKRIVQLMPCWNPATENAQAIKSRIGMSFPFYISSQYISSKAEINLNPEQSAKFPNGKKAMNEFITKERGYENPADGVESVLVVCEKDGSLTNFETVNITGYTQTGRAYPIIKAMPKWEPAMDKGVPVRSQKVIKVWF